MSANKLPTVVERYYTRKYKTDICNKKGHDVCALIHSNKLCIVTVAKSHPLIADGLSIERVDFQVDKKTNRLDNHVTGKGKKGGQFLVDNAVLCIVHCKDGQTFKIHCPVRGLLVEINEYLATQPDLITHKYQTEGYIAIVCPRLKECGRESSKLLTEDQYREEISKRTSNVAESGAE